jgi:hypothetical protein
MAGLARSATAKPPCPKPTHPIAAGSERDTVGDYCAVTSAIAEGRAWAAQTSAASDKLNDQLAASEKLAGELQCALAASRQDAEVLFEALTSAHLNSLQTKAAALQTLTSELETARQSAKEVRTPSLLASSCADM